MALAAAALFLLTQAPFIYRRVELGRLAAKIAELNARRAAADPLDPYADYKGVVHVHTFLGGHSGGGFAEIVQAAQSNRLDFVVMSEHPSQFFDTRRATLQGTHGGVLFVAGNETSESERDRFLTFGGDVSHATGQREGQSEPATQPPALSSTQAVIDRAKVSGDLVMIAHPETYQSWDSSSGYDGMEVYNLHADAKDVNRWLLFFDGLWSYRSYAPLLWTKLYDAPTENLRRWDQLTASGRRQRIVAVAGNDAHANVGFSLQELTGRPVWQLKLDPYERSFQVVRTHVLLERDQPLTRESLLTALREGHAYVSFDLLTDATGFRFTATDGTREKLMGDEVTLSTGGAVSLRVRTPLPCRVRLVRDGQTFDASKETEMNWQWMINGPGVYRVEAYLPQLPTPLSQKPWIISNPIYVRTDDGR